MSAFLLNAVAELLKINFYEKFSTTYLICLFGQQAHNHIVLSVFETTCSNFSKLVFDFNWATKKKSLKGNEALTRRM